MKPIQSVMVVGAGAVGAAVAGNIHESIPGAVSVFADGERATRYRRDGFVLNGVRRDFPFMTPDSGAIPDLVIIAVKAHHLSDALSSVKPLIGRNTLILSLLNGITSEEIIGAAFGSEKVPLGMILGIDAVRVGNDTRFSSTGKIFFGDALNKPGSWSERVSRISEFFDRAGIIYEVPDNMLRALWYKFMINVGINQASAVLRAKYRVFQTIPEARGAMESGMKEVVALSKVMGTGLTDQDIVKWYETLMALGPEGATSMFQDVEAKRKTEVEIFAGAVMELGRKTGTPTPVNELWYDLIRTIELSY